MTSPEVLTNNPSATENSANGEYESEDELESTVAGRISAYTSNNEESSVARLTGTSLLKSVHNTKRNSLQSSNHTLQSDKTYDFDRKDGLYDSLTEFADDSARSLRSVSSHNGSPPEPVDPFATGRVPAWKLRQQALRKNSPPPPKKVIESTSRPPKQPNNLRRSPFGTLRKTDAGAANNTNGSGDPNGDKTWLQRLRNKKESEEEKEKRIQRESLIEKQVSSRWGKDILEEDSDEDGNKDEDDKEKAKEKETNDEKEEKDEVKDGDDDGDDENDESEKPAKQYKDEDESDTVKKVKSLIEKSFGSALVATIKKDKEQNAPDASVFAKDTGDGESKDDGDDAEKKNPPVRGNRWAMMGSAAMTSVRNLQRGLIGSGDDKNTDKDTTIQTSESIEEGDENDSENKDEDGDKVAEEISPRRSAMWKNRGGTVFTSVRNAWGGAASRRQSLEINDDGKDGEEDDTKSVQSDPGRINHEDDSNNKNNNNLFSHIGNFIGYHRAKLDPKVWEDQEIQESLSKIEKLKIKLQDCRTVHRNDTRRREKQVENSIMQQKIFLARKLHRLRYGYKKDPFHPCIKEVYEKEIRIIVHDATSLFGDPDAEHEKDGIDDLLDSSRFEYDFPEDNDDVTTKSGDGTIKSGDGSIIDMFLGRKNIDDERSVDTFDSILQPQNGRVINRDSLVPLETRLLRAQHNEWMTEHQMELVRPFQQSMVGYCIDLLPELRADHEKLKKIPQEAVEAKCRELEEYNAALKKAYEAHLEAQEKLLAIYRERYVPSVHEDDNEDESHTNKDQSKETDEDDDENGEKDDTFLNAPTTPTRQIRKEIRPNMWAKNLGESVRGLFGPKKDEAEDDKEKDEKDTNGPTGESSEIEDGFSLPSPITGGSFNENKFLLSFGSPSGSAAKSGILANFTAPPLSTTTNGTDDDAHTDAKDSTRLSLQESAADSAEAAWNVPKRMDRGSLPETAAEKRSRRAAERAAARKANRPDSISTGSSRIGTTTGSTSNSRSELLERARKARQESTDALKSQDATTPVSPTPSGRTSRTGRTSLRSSAGASTATATSRSARNGNSRKELSMKDLLEKAGDSRRKLQENDSRMERLARKKDRLTHSPLNSPVSSISKGSASGERRRRIATELKHDDSVHSLHERAPRKSLTKLGSRSKISNSSSHSRNSNHSNHSRISNHSSRHSRKPWHTNDDEDELKNVDEFGDEN